MRTGRDLHILAKDPHLRQEDTCLCLCLCVCLCRCGYAMSPQVGAAVGSPHTQSCPRAHAAVCGCNLPCTYPRHTLFLSTCTHCPAQRAPCAKCWHICGCVPALHVRVPFTTAAGTRASCLAASWPCPSVHLCAGVSACVSDLVRPRLCERLSSPFFRSAVNCNQIKAANHLGPLKRAYVP